jgi:beta-lactamase class A
VAEVTEDPQAVRAALASYLTSQGAHGAVAVLDRVTGARVSYNESIHFNTASIIKVDILGTLLWQAQGAGRQLTASQQELARRMITASDNNAAITLWSQIGRTSGLAKANRAFGMTQTVPSSAWGSTSTTATDQLRLLQVLADPGGPLSAASQHYELGLMSHVQADQRWGVPRAAGRTATAVYVKNGWFPFSADHGRWTVNSVGRIVEPGHDWLVAVLSDHHGTEARGITIVEHLASIAVDGLRQS